jgi:hypothetical protein
MPNSGLRIHCQTSPVTMKDRAKGIEHDGAEGVFEPDLLVEQGRQGEADDSEKISEQMP